MDRAVGWSARCSSRKEEVRGSTGGDELWDIRYLEAGELGSVQASR
jgi:hypothetical protein